VSGRYRGVGERVREDTPATSTRSSTGPDPILPSGTSSASIRAIRVAETDDAKGDAPPVTPRSPHPASEPPERVPILAVPPPGRASVAPLGSIGAGRSSEKALPPVTPIPPPASENAPPRVTPNPDSPRPRTNSPVADSPRPRTNSPIPDSPRPRTNSPIPPFDLLDRAPDSQPPQTGRPITGTRSARPTTGPVSVRRKSHGDSDGLQGTDRRSSPRARYATFIRIAAGDRKLDGRSDTISPTGVSVIVNDGLPEGTNATARFALPVTDSMVSLPCTVMWELPHRSGGRLVGLSFSLVSFEVEQEIRQYVEAVGELPSDPPPG
jgi:hypothetical protein